VSPYLQHTDEAVWGPDAGEWRPERWEDPAGAAEGVHPYSYMPFSRGARCGDGEGRGAGAGGPGRAPGVPNQAPAGARGPDTAGS
jgi:hypothetical protein